MARVLITGAGGYVGSGLARTLQEDGWEVIALGRQPAPYLDVEQVVADLDQDSDAARRACAGVDAVVHLAGENEVVAARSPAAALAATVLATERLVEALWRAIEEARSSGEWLPSPGSFCRWCSFQDLCPAFGNQPPPLPEPAVPGE